MRVYLVLLLLFLLNATHGQEKKDKWIRVGLSGAASITDLSKYESFGAVGMAGLQFNKKKRLNGAFLLGYGTIEGNDPSFTSPVAGKSPNRFFSTRFLFGHYDLHYNFIKTDKVILYISQGIGFIRFTPEDQFGQSLEDQLDTRADDETYRNLSLILPTKLGAMYILPNQFAVGGEVGFMGTMTDYLDNISELGDSGNDNIFALNLNLFIPLYNP